MTIRILFVFSLISVSAAYSQKRVAEMPLPDVSKDGFYRIRIPAEYYGYFSPNLNNLRISDGSEYDVPFITGQSVEEARSRFTPYEIIAREQRKGCCTRIVFRAEGAISNIQLRVKNAEAIKSASLLGSDDQQTWFVLKQRFNLSYFDGIGSTSEIRIVDFPLSNYQFYQLEINDSLTAPLNILEVGSYDHIPQRLTFAPLSEPRLEISQTDQNRSRIIMRWDTLQRIDRLEIYASGPPFFRRSAALYANSREGRRKNQTQKDWFGSAELLNGKSAVINPAFPLISEAELIIENLDSPPLRIDSIRAFQVERFLVAHLQKNSSYKILVYETGMRAPLYDLELFRNKIPGDLEIVTPGQLAKPGFSEQEADFFTSGLMWAAILLIMAILGFYSYRMVKRSEVT
jgi:hypothetical protein